MRNDERFEIERAIDLLPHVIGASWAMTFFRLKKIRNPTKEEFREKTIEYLLKIEPLLKSFSNDKIFSEIQNYIETRGALEIEKIKNGENNEIEKRYKRYIEYG
ncbi:MAG: hypothetical protein CMO17_02700 [Thaumarchaeota archaeon]|nr:hypothetical protein [Nitrososphaerota archaeon]|tara:strand:+ start:294 stop:605 length:312 start_codon:yes stop_codon:yes gene_type:complete